MTIVVIGGRGHRSQGYEEADRTGSRGHRGLTEHGLDSMNVGKPIGGI
jgi:hypothetical protein